MPDIDSMRLIFEAVERESDDGFNLHKYGIGYADEATQKRWQSWLSCRAAMLQAGNSPVIPDGWVMVPVEMTAEQMRAVQIKSELGEHATANLAGSYSLFSEFWRVAISAATKKEV